MANFQIVCWTCHDCLHADDRGLEGRYVHMFSGRSGFEGEIAGMGAYAHEDGTYNVALQARVTPFVLCCYKHSILVWQLCGKRISC
jgi:hypothetical protein